MVFKGWRSSAVEEEVEGQRSRVKVKYQIAPPGGYVMNQCRHLAEEKL